MIQYTRKENAKVQTEEGKFDFTSDPQANRKEWTLQRELEDAEAVILDQKNISADQKDQIYEIK